MTKAETTYRVAEEPDGETSEAIVEESLRLGPEASNPDIVDAVAENHDVDTSPSWVSRVRNKHLEEIEAGEEDTQSEGAGESNGVDRADPGDPTRGLTASPPAPGEDGEGWDSEALPAVVEEVVNEYHDEVVDDVNRLEDTVAELRRSIERLVEAIESDTYPTDLSEYPEEVQKELRADVLETELKELQSGAGN